MDPFRSRAALWGSLPKARRRRLVDALVAALEARCTVIKGDLKTESEADRKAIGLELELQTLRLRWLRAESW